jgi:glycosyltransferase involved in cell wall biosynthesis
MEKRKPHVVVYSAIKADYGGVEQNLIQQVRLLADRYRFTVLCQGSPSFQQAIQAAGARWESITIPPPFSASAIHNLAARLRGDLAGDLIYTLDPRGCTVGCLAGKFARIPTVHCNNVSPLDYPYTGWLRYRFHVLGEMLMGWGFIDASIFVAEHLRQRYLGLHLVPLKRGYYIPNGIDPANFQAIRSRRAAVRARLGIPQDTFLWVHLGRMTYQKAHEVILNAACQLPHDRPWKLLLVGDGILRESIQAQIQGLQLSERVQLLNALPHEQALEILAAGDGLVFPSRYENMPNAVLEAMALGVPVVVTPVGDSWRMVGEGDLPPAGLCVPVDDVSALRQAMIRLMSDSALYNELRGACAPRAAPFTIQRTIEGIDAIFRKLLV